MEKVFGVFMDEKLNMSRQYALTAQKVNHIKRSAASRLSEGIFPLLHPRDTPSEVSCTVLGSSAKQRRGPVIAGPGKGCGDGQRDGAHLL